jgi:hypothetical protein
MPDHITMNLLETLGLQSSQIIQQLDETFPPVTPSPRDDISMIMYKAGQRSVVEWLQKKLEE